MVLKAAGLGLSLPPLVEQLGLVLVQLDAGDKGPSCWVDWLMVLQPAPAAQLHCPQQPCWWARRQAGEEVIAARHCQASCRAAECLDTMTAPTQALQRSAAQRMVRGQLWADCRTCRHADRVQYSCTQ